MRQRPGQQPRRLALLNISTKPPQLHRGVLERHGRARVDEPLELGDLLEQVVDPLAGFSPGQGGGQAGTGSVEPLQLEQAGFEALFEGGERGGLVR